jgi:DNA primase
LKVKMAIDARALKDRVDLVDLAGQSTRLKKVAGTRGGEWAGPCPFCGGRDRFHVQPATGLWRCRQCSPDQRWQDAIAFVMRRDGVPFAEACSLLGASSSELGEMKRLPRPQQPAGQLSEDIEPSATWRERAADFVEECKQALWSEHGARARTYLGSKGLKDQTLRVWHVGFHVADRYEPAVRWSLDGRDVWLPRGIVFPWLIERDLWMVKIRRATDDPKYWAVRGGHPLLFGAETLVPGGPAVLVEGEKDALLAWQAVNDRMAVVSLGSASRWRTHRGALLLAQATPLLLAYDVDAEGERGATRLQQLVPRARRIRPPVGKDIGEFIQAGGRARAWMTYELKRIQAGL